MVLIANTGGDMVVEYVSSILAALILHHFGGYSVAFRFSGGAPSSALIAQALAAQLLPELGCDALTMIAEASCV